MMENKPKSSFAKYASKPDGFTTAVTIIGPDGEPQCAIVIRDDTMRRTISMELSYSVAIMQIGEVLLVPLVLNIRNTDCYYAVLLDSPEDDGKLLNLLATQENVIVEFVRGDGVEISLDNHLTMEIKSTFSRAYEKIHKTTKWSKGQYYLARTQLIEQYPTPKDLALFIKAHEKKTKNNPE
jgi:hypothetical protein